MPVKHNCVTAQMEHHVLTLGLAGEIDHHNAGAVRMELDDKICETRPARVVLDLGNIDFMDSSGLGLIMGRFATVKKLGGDLIIKNPTERVKRILDLAGMERIIPIEYDQTNQTNQTKGSDSK